MSSKKRKHYLIPQTEDKLSENQTKKLKKNIEPRVIDKLASDKGAEIKIEIEKTNSVRKKRVYTKQIKEDSVKLVNNYGLNVTSIITSIPYGALNRWKSCGIISQNSGKKRGRPLTHPLIDQMLFDWILETRARKLAVTTRRLILKGKCLLNSHGFNDIGFSYGWLRKFIERHNLAIRKITTGCRRLESDVNADVKLFLNKYHELILENEYADDFILNVDETSVPRDYPAIGL